MIELFANIKEKYPDIKVPNVIVNNAGIFILSNFLDLNENIFDKIVSVNLKGPFLVTHTAVQELIKIYPNKTLGPLDTYASIINISSIAGKKGFPYNQAIYAATKGGLDSLTKQTAFELAEYKIRVNSVAPGPIRTEMNANLPREISDIHTGITYFNRLGEVTEVAEACVFLASDKSSYTTGSILEVNGGIN